MFHSIGLYKLRLLLNFGVNATLIGTFFREGSDIQHPTLDLQSYCSLLYRGRQTQPTAQKQEDAKRTVRVFQVQLQEV